MRILVSGSVAWDLIMDFPGKFADHIDPEKIHLLNLSFAVRNLKQNLGGTAANICYNLALLKIPCEMVAAIGFDGKDILQKFRNLGIGTRYLKISKTLRTAAAYIMTDRDDNQITGFYAGAMDEAMKPPPVKAGDWAVVAAENPKNMVRLAKYYQRQKVNYIFDPGQQVTALSPPELATGVRGAKILMGNDYELGLVAGRIKVNCPIVVRTLGPKGSEILIQGGGKLRIGIARPKKVVDPTGAGDAYRAGFLKGLILGYNLKTCGQLGAIVASFAVEEYGTQNHKFTWKEIVRCHNQDFKGKI